VEAKVGLSMHVLLCIHKSYSVCDRLDMVTTCCSAAVQRQLLALPAAGWEDECWQEAAPGGQVG
jgi:hypothetical protein